jgi:plastocyanin
MESGTKLFICCATGLALAAPGAAQAATKSVSMGPPATKQAKPLGETYFSDALAYFPGAISVKVGDAVRFVPTGFHTVHFLGKSGKPAAAVIPTGKDVSGVLDAAGAPFGFNGLAEVGFNPALFAPGGLGKTITTNGTKEIQSGAPVSDKPKPMIVKFTKAGLFRYICDLHPGMKGSVRVVAASKGVPSAAADAARVKTQVTKALATAKGFASLKPPANTVVVGPLGAGAVTQFGFAPGNLTVPAGTTVNFRAPTNSGEIHTVSFGPGDPDKEPTSYLGAIAKRFENDPNPPSEAVYPSDPAPAPVTLTSGLHGNGFWNSGILDGAAVTPLAQSKTLTFGEAGSFNYYCLIHPFMKGTITVT